MIKLKESISKNAVMLLGTLATVIVGTTIRGDILLVAKQLYKLFQFDSATVETSPSQHNETKPDFSNALLSGTWKTLLQTLYLENVSLFVTISVVITFASYFSLGGYMQYYYYYKRKEQATEWKCQPTKWLTPANERHEILLGSCNMLLGATISGILVTYIYNDGPCRLYLRVGERGVLYLIISTVLVFLFQDAMAYYTHRMSHIPVLYKLYHKMHHRYTCPTAFSAVAMHPFEFLMYQTVLVAPMFLIPIYSGAFLSVLLYNYYYGMVDHSGVKMDALWPWQPPTMFHDNHHRLFHVNFGFNTYIWDWLHDTLRKDSRQYGENIFGGRGTATTNKNR